MYFIEKVGQYGHGVFWIGEDLVEGVHELLLKCRGDSDDHHKWDLQEYNRNSDPSINAHNKVLVSVTKRVVGRKPNWSKYKELTTEVGDVVVLGGFDTILENFNGGMRYTEECLEQPRDQEKPAYNLVFPPNLTWGHVPASRVTLTSSAEPQGYTILHKGNEVELKPDGGIIVNKRVTLTKGGDIVVKGGTE